MQKEEPQAGKPGESGSKGMVRADVKKVVVVPNRVVVDAVEFIAESAVVASEPVAEVQRQAEEVEKPGEPVFVSTVRVDANTVVARISRVVAARYVVDVDNKL